MRDPTLPERPAMIHMLLAIVLILAVGAAVNFIAEHVTKQ